MENMVEIRQVLPRYNKLPTYCAVCSSFATVEVHKQMEGIDMIGVEKFCARHAPIVLPQIDSKVRSWLNKAVSISG